MSQLTKIKSIIVSVFIIAGAFSSLMFNTANVSAVSASEWTAGNIVSDSIFFSGDSLSVSGIQNFLNSKVTSCDTWGTKIYSGNTTRAQSGTSRGYPPPYTCLKDYTVSTRSVAANSYCQAITGGDKSAAQIIYDVGIACGVNPKALLVMLEKEQGLVTDTWPFSIQYRGAMGYGCPDTAPCDSEYYGLFNQVYNAARQFKLYATKQNSYRYRAFQSNYIQWSPTASCGGSNVYIDNLATSGLYNYTPYQPNAAALTNLYGTGDGCSAYGNRNFWRIYNDWFESTQYEKTLLTYKSYTSSSKWSAASINSGVTGSTGQNKPLTALRIDGDVTYSSYNSTTGWQPAVTDGMVSGSLSTENALQAIKISLGDSISNNYNVWYRVHVSYIGWMGWAKNGESAGVTSSNTNNNIETIEISVVPKSFSAPGTTSDAFRDLGSITYSPNISLSVSSHVGMVGWQPAVTDGMVSGTTELSRRIEALKLSLDNKTGISGDITYSSHVSFAGWQDYVKSNDVSGTVGKSLAVEAVRITLTGELADRYDVWYRGYVQYSGWLDWTKNGSPAGSVGASRQLEALEVRLLPKGSTMSPSINALYNPSNQAMPSSSSISYSAHISYVGWRGEYRPYDVGGTTGQSRTLEAVRFDSAISKYGNLSITCSVQNLTNEWSSSVSIGNTCGTTGQHGSLLSIKLKLSGSAASKYDIYHRVHRSWLGWGDWVKNDSPSNSASPANPIEAIELYLIEK